MGKDIFINGGDFSVNGFSSDEDVIGIAVFTVGKAYNAEPPGTITNNTRCMFNVSLPSEYAEYNKIKMKVKDGFDYVFGVNRGTVTTWYKGNEIVTTYSWITDTQEVVAPVSVGDVVYVNLRYDDNTTVFANDTVISDIVNSIVLTADYE